ncbi:hypothetical protein G6038_27325 [Rhodococcus sp. 14C212]|uniref:hypothetical protein n=1 Tax=Rhodococcus sp. 14C212 TaxID=2711209 RepID=UPI0013EAF0DF|nr:hypothetical protein [Rhodococcus sp. 14C212]NGP09119.1 hypothetical protein [Rhodococcus sp. 14C212]
MKLNLFVAWTGYMLALLSIVSLAAFLFAAGSGNGGWALVAGVVCVVAVATAIAMIGSTVHHDHRLHRETPHLF